jgi:hypothetical protein
MPLPERSNGLLRYEFSCQCPACKAPNKYLTFEEMQSNSEEYRNFAAATKEVILLGRMNVSKFTEKFPEYCAYINRNDGKYPTKEICTAQRLFQQCLELFAISENY